MTDRRRNTIVLLALAALVALAWWTRARWLPGLLVGIESRASLIQAIEALVNIGGALVPLLLALLALLGLRRPSPQTPPPLVRPVALDALRDRVSPERVNWINRGATHPDQLLASRRLVIRGVSKVGKSREAVELIARALPFCHIPASRIFQPTIQLRGTEASALAAQLRKDVATTDEPLLLFVDDLPREYKGGELDRLAAALAALERCKALYVALSIEHHCSWLLNNLVLKPRAEMAVSVTDSAL